MQNYFSANVLLESYDLQALYANDVGPAVSLDHALLTKRGLLMRVSKKIYVLRHIISSAEAKAASSNDKRIRGLMVMELVLLRHTAL